MSDRLIEEPIGSENIPSVRQELKFLYNVIPAKKYTISIVLQVESFANKMIELKSKGVTIDNDILYTELKNIVFPIFYEISSFESLGDFKRDYIGRLGDDAYRLFWSNYKAIKKALGELCENAFGDKFYWQFDFENQYGFRFIQPESKVSASKLDENSDLAYLSTVSGVSEKIHNAICSDEAIVKAFRKNETVSSIEEIYNVIKVIFYKSARLGFKNNPKTKKLYFQRRRLIESLCEVIYGDKKYWHNDYAQWIKENSI